MEKSWENPVSMEVYRLPIKKRVVILFDNVGKGMVNLPFGDDVYHPFIAIYGHFIFIGFIC
jgi:hypothetical protein